MSSGEADLINHALSANMSDGAQAARHAESAALTEAGLSIKQRIQAYSRHASWPQTLAKGDFLVTMSERTAMGFKNPFPVTYAHNARDDSIGKDIGEITTRNLSIGPIAEVRPVIVQGQPSLMCKIPSLKSGPSSWRWVMASCGFRPFFEWHNPAMYLLNDSKEIHLPTPVEKEIFNLHLDRAASAVGNAFASPNEDGTSATANNHFAGGDSVRVGIWDADLNSIYENQEIHLDKVVDGQNILKVNCLEHILQLDSMRHISAERKTLYRLIILPQSHGDWSKFLMETIRMHDFP
jgi:hypothetical protein